MEHVLVLAVSVVLLRDQGCATGSGLLFIWYLLHHLVNRWRPSVDRLDSTSSNAQEKDNMTLVSVITRPQCSASWECTFQWNMTALISPNLTKVVEVGGMLC